MGPVALQVPDISNVAVFLDITDPVGDDHGPGTYTYPSDAVFTQGSYDIERFTVGTENDQLVLAFDMVAPIQNPWGSPRNFSIQTFDIYIDTDPGSDNGETVVDRRPQRQRRRRIRLGIRHHRRRLGAGDLPGRGRGNRRRNPAVLRRCGLRRPGAGCGADPAVTARRGRSGLPGDTRRW